MTDAPPWRDWHHMPGVEIDRCDREHTVVMLTSSPIEVHGPHLPTITDICESEGLSERVMRKLKARHPELSFLRLPPVYVAADVLPHVGSIAFRQSTIRRVFEDLGRSLAVQGFKHVWIGGFHGGPRHFVPIELACERVNRRRGTRMLSTFALMMQHLTGGGTDLAELLGGVEGADQASLRGDAHGGCIETSMMLHLLGEHVRPVYRDLHYQTVHTKRAEAGQPSIAFEGRPALPVLVRALVAKLKYYEQNTWSGDPSLGDAALGERFLDVLAECAAEALSRYWTGEIPLSDTHSPVWKLRWAFTSELVTGLVQWVTRYENRVF